MLTAVHGKRQRSQSDYVIMSKLNGTELLIIIDKFSLYSYKVSNCRIYIILINCTVHTFYSNTIDDFDLISKEVREVSCKRQSSDIFWSYKDQQ